MAGRARWARFAVGLVALVSASAADDTPGWLKELVSAPLPQYPAKVNTVVLLQEEHTTAAGSGRFTTVTRTAVKVLTQQGAGVLFFDQYDSRSGKVRDFRAWMLAPSGKSKKYGKDEIVDVACAENDVYNECRRRMVSGKRDAVPGSIFAYESTVEYESFSNQVSFHFQDSSPVRLARFLVTAPAGWELKSAAFNGAPAEAAPAGGTYTWRMENLPAIEREPSSPSFLTLVPWVGVNLLPPGSNHQMLSWPAAAKLLGELNTGQNEPNDAIRAKARSLIEGAATELDKIRAIGRFTQQINYVSIQTNISKGGGYRPHAAAQAFQKLYGDCKDKANLTRAMLNAVGITAFPVAIYSGDRTHVREEWPSLGAFNHAISAIRVSAETQAPAVLDHPKLGRLLFFDPTDPYVPPGYLPEREQASLALVSTADGGDLVRVPAATAKAAERERTVEAVLAADGSIAGKFVEKRTGEALADAISRFRGQPRADFVQSVERWIGESIAGANSSGIEALDENGAFTLKGQFASARFAQRPQAGMLVLRAGLLRHGDLRYTAKVRKYPLVVNADGLHETVRLDLPKDFHVDELPRAIRIDSEFGKFTANWVARDGALVFERTLEILAQTVPAARYAELKKFLDIAAGSEDAPVVLVK